MIWKTIVAFILAWIAAYLLGAALLTIGGQPLVAAGAFLKTYAGLIAVLAALGYYFKFKE